MTGPRDWDKELADIDKVIAKNNAAPPPAPSAAPVSAPAREVTPRLSAPAASSTSVTTRGRDKVGVWLRTLLGVAGAVALPYWPYSKSCGALLFVYLFGTLGVMAAGIWAMRGAWIHRRGIALVAGMLVVMAGVVLALLEVLHRTGFAATKLGWICP